nr:MAG TPA: hypothetical protein [Caudoviricetes sp.]
MRPLRRGCRHILRHMPVLRLPAVRAQTDWYGSAVWHDRQRILQAIREHVMEDVGILLTPPPDLVELAEALDIMAQPHVGSGWANLNFDGLPCSTPRQEAIWMEYNGITRGD